MTNSFLSRWLPPFAWVLLIFVASTDLLSADHTSRLLVPFLRWLRPDIAPATVVAVQFAVRKAAHVMEYGVLAMLLARAVVAWAEGVRFARVVLVMSIVSVCAAIDEFHQSFVASRTGSLVDVSIDVTGAVIGIVGYLLWTRWRSRRATAHTRAPDRAAVTE